MILYMLSYHEINIKELLKYLEIFQPTISHHIKVLVGNEIVISSKKEQPFIIV